MKNGGVYSSSTQFDIKAYNGNGNIKWADGSEYNGIWLKNAPLQGKGTFIKPNGEKQKGEWISGL